MTTEDVEAVVAAAVGVPVVLEDESTFKGDDGVATTPEEVGVEAVTGEATELGLLQITVVPLLELAVGVEGVDTAPILEGSD